MNPTPTKIPGCFRVDVQMHEDARGYFATMFDLRDARRIDPRFEVVRLNRSLTRSKGVIRGLHFQRGTEAEDKLVQCLTGSIYDVCVDLRPDSPTHLQWVATELTADRPQLLWIPKGCAHGFQTLAENCLIEYLTNGNYSPGHEGGVRWNDPALGIPWPLPCSRTSEKDGAWPLLAR